MRDENPERFGAAIGAREVRFRRRLPGAVERVWTYLTDPDLRATWLAGGEMEPRGGGRMELAFFHADLSPQKAEPPERFREMAEKGHRMAGTVLAWEPPRLLVITWGSKGEGPSEVSFELEALGPDETLMTLTHRKLADPGEMANVGSGWHAHLAILEDRLAGRTPPSFWTVWEGLEAAYARRFTEAA
ncbi:MAG: SRPBCC family protein [Phenylobacterium sp.]|uniref:SRPBCC family protein n=1 Tax=Phenylobacterium sp. TaxID=1871053 RepID=UPI00391BC056